MEVTQSPSTAEAVPAAAETKMSPFTRAIATFTNPSGAMAGLRSQTQWWFPLLLILLFGALMMTVLYQRAIVPTNLEVYDQLVDQGVFSPEQAAQAEQQARGPQGFMQTLIGQVIFIPVILLILGAGIAFGVSFLLGTKLPFRQGFEVVLWANLIMLPAGILTGILAWTRESMRGIHLGPGVLVPMSDPPVKWEKFLGSFLDAFGPFELWTVWAVIIGASVLSGAPRKSVMWVIGGLYLLIRVLWAALAMLAPG
jgi:Yip1 domain